jgi:renalase
MRVVVVGAGISGLVAARSLVTSGAEVVVVDKGRSPGGRLATRRIGTATLDHGAQFFTVRTPAFQRQVDDWIRRGLVTVWTNGFDSDDGHPRYAATAGMNSLAKDLATGLDVRCSTMAFSVRPRGDDGWEVAIDDGTAHPADAVIVSTPVPQAFALLADSGLPFDAPAMPLEYDRIIALLATLDGATLIPPPGGLQAPTPDLAFVGDNHAKGVSASPAITVHASPSWSEDHWDDDLDDLRTTLVGLVEPWLGETQVVEAQVKKWRFAAPRSTSPDPCWIAEGGSVVLCGDAFDGPRVEGAHNSGLAAAHALTG